MDEAQRARSRPIRTLGRIATPAVDDVLLAQWSAEHSGDFLHQDIAIGSEWAGTVDDNLFLGTPAQSSDSIGLHRSALLDYENHMRHVVQRLLEAIDADVARDGRIPLAYEAPPVSQETALAGLAALVAAGEMTAGEAAGKRDRIMALCEASARLWVLAGLFRTGHISARDLAAKRDGIAHRLQ